MNAKTTIRKILFVTIWLCIGGGMLTLLLAAISSKKKGVCSDYEITLKGPKNNFFISEQDVEQMLAKAGAGKIRGEAIESFRLHEMEELLEKNTWISDAEIYFDNKQVLHVTVSEKEPVARIFSTNGDSFYIDQTGKKMPLSDKLSAKVPVFTGFPDKKRLSVKDSALLQEIRETAQFILADSFWQAQVAQVDINTEGNMEMIPVVGNHVVKLGRGEQIPSKFNRLMVFYRQVLSKTGFDKYKIIDVQYKGQVVASRYAGNPKVDSVQLRRNVEKLLKQYMESANDTVVRILTPITTLENDSAAGNNALPNENIVSPEPPKNPNPGLDPKTPSVNNNTDGQAEKKTVKKPDQPKQPEKKKTEKKKTDTKKEEKKAPKAVMPKKPVEEENGGYN